ncbi:amino acid ABC transporter permease [Clostridium botulinum]|uniref:Amino acid ABC transporter permease n=2 Tax=Clostridium botulinum TaxID=1491 RepID=A0A846I009_CLOBO|nr:amino acid ABC transporter permease [Clostridium botulinum]AJD27163.1 putative amino-acid permease protein yxeN [Clostridium botulinum CDC_297]EPS52153.1 amino acid ABC transporter permease [Clostridium botulinum A1 str. CFSAN002368]ACQ52658.1 amino acid ABC transporter, permease protein, His/Glu/Gln/Arg/opine family [Clostridium botulinum Ba4 str. 657]AJE10906.1 putative amino-acid permease protein yxeN [Clostridium botulinum CDC_1436]APR01423.1 amino ABC transporter, permease, 3-TM region
MEIFDVKYLVQSLIVLLKYAHITLSIAILSMIIAVLFGVILAVIRMYKVKFLHSISEIYISFFRGTPILIQLFLFYYGLPQIIPSFKEIPAYMAVVIALSMNGSAYMAEIIRGAIMSIDKGQMEASLSLGMTEFQAMKRIILPQAARVAIPSLGNSFIDLLKSSSLAFTVGVAEILSKAQMNAASSYRFFESYLAVALIYWVMVELFNFMQKLLERRIGKAY